MPAHKYIPPQRLQNTECAVLINRFYSHSARLCNTVTAEIDRVSIKQKRTGIGAVHSGDYFNKR